MLRSLVTISFRKLSLIIILHAAFLFQARAQQLTPRDKNVGKSAFYLELGGAGMLYSINYDRVIISKSPIVKYTAGLGVATFGISYPDKNRVYHGRHDAWIFPVHFNALIGPGKHHLELGIANSLINTKEVILQQGEFISETEMGWYTQVSGRIGYRYQKAGEGLLLRAGFTPSFYSTFSKENDGGFNFNSWGGISIGFTF